ncbi:NAD(P)-binding protein [Lindgomyces ingoldianus]|uniref:NAD(P)-binding protein n=1 Tax=Lindgomyces ingoldianus TaxID=673940 RepID=A0ACB6QFD6_9PLEO|nr:NAD(P)-binding protein [Lindgomyces ingoldianus]KAF2465617.1 NAD(P)-binding protein [Lindgomyces ingoldianus]
MSSIIAVAGGSGGLGRALVERLKASGQYTVLVLARQKNPELEQHFGIRVVAADYSNTDSLVRLQRGQQLLEDQQIDTVISAINPRGPSPELNLIKAADRSKVTRRYIPSIWSGVDYAEEDIKRSHFAAEKIGLTNALKKTTLQWTAIYLGVYLDYYAPGLESYIHPVAICVDTINNAAGIAGTGEYPVTLTWSFDVAKYTVALLHLKGWENKYFIVGSQTTWNELVSLTEDVKGVKFRVSYDSVEKMLNGEVTELPAHVGAYVFLGGSQEGKVRLQGFLSALGLFFARGSLSYEGHQQLNEMFPDISPIGLRDALQKSFTENSRV